MSLSWTQTFVPLVFGLDAWLLPEHWERVFVGVLGQGLFVLALVITIRRRRVASRAWILFGITFLTMSVLVGLTRVSAFGPGEADDVRYCTLDAFFAVIALGIAWLPVRPEVGPAYATAGSTWNHAGSHARSARHAGSTRGHAVRRNVAIPALCALVALYATALVFDQDHDPTVQGDHGDRRFFATFTASWARVTANAKHPFLWDTEVDPVAVSHAFYPDDTASVTVGMLHRNLQFDAWGGRGFLIRADGSVVPAIPVRRATGILPTRTGACVTAGSQPAGISLTLNRSLGAQRWFGLVSYRSTTGAVALESGGATADFPRGRGTLITNFPPVPLSVVGWGVPAHRQLCITGLTIVLPEPSGTHLPPVHPLDAPQPPTGKTR